MLAGTNLPTPAFRHENALSCRGKKNWLFIGHPEAEVIPIAEELFQLLARGGREETGAGGRTCNNGPGVS